MTLGPRVMPEVNDGAIGVANVVASAELLMELPVGPKAGVPVELFTPAPVVPDVVVPPPLTEVSTPIVPPVPVTPPDVVVVVPGGVIAKFCKSAPTP